MEEVEFGSAGVCGELGGLQSPQESREEAGVTARPS